MTPAATQKEQPPPCPIKEPFPPPGHHVNRALSSAHALRHGEVLEGSSGELLQLLPFRRRDSDRVCGPIVIMGDIAADRGLEGLKGCELLAGQPALVTACREKSREVVVVEQSGNGFGTRVRPRALRRGPTRAPGRTHRRGRGWPRGCARASYPYPSSRSLPEPEVLQRNMGRRRSSIDRAVARVIGHTILHPFSIWGALRRIGTGGVTGHHADVVVRIARVGIPPAAAFPGRLDPPVVRDAAWPVVLQAMLR